MEKYTEAVKMLDDLKRQVSQGHLDLKDLQIKDQVGRCTHLGFQLRFNFLSPQQMNRQLIAVQEKISSSRNQNDAKKTIMEEKLHLLQQQYIVVSSELAKTKQKIEENNKKMESMKAKMVEKKREHSIVVETIQESYEKMRDHLNEYMESFRSIMV